MDDCAESFLINVAMFISPLFYFILYTTGLISQRPCPTIYNLR